MIFQPEASRDIFLQKLTSLQEALAQRQLINDRLEVEKKNGFYWTILCLLDPFCSIFFYDVFSHVRVDNVGKSVIAYFKANEAYFDEAVIERFKERFLIPLHAKKASYYLSEERLDSLLPLPPLQWPVDLSLLGISDDQKRMLEMAFSAVLPKTFGEEPTISCTKTKDAAGNSQRQLVRTNVERQILAQADIPITVLVDIQASRKKSSIVLWTKVEIGKGGQRKVKQCFDLLKGEFSAVRKKCCSTVEKLILEHFQYKPSPGIEPIDKIQRRLDSQFKSDHIIEPIFDGDLYDTLSKLTEVDGRSIMHQLAEGLSKLHAFQPVDITYSSDLTTRTTVTYPYTFHLDIKPNNILIRRLKGPNGIQAVLADFGTAGKLRPGIGTPGYVSPEDMKLHDIFENKTTSMSADQVGEMLLSYNQKKDVWALGLVFTVLICKAWYNVKKPIPGGSKQTSTLVAPLRCIAEAIEKSKKDDELIAHLTQDAIDASLVELKEAVDSCYATIIDNLISKMLKVDPQKRISSKEVFEIYSTL